MKTTIFIIIALTVLPLREVFSADLNPEVIYPEDPSRSAQFGVLFLLNYNNHTAAFSKLPGVPGCCHEYTNGDGYGFTIGLVHRAPLSALLSLESRLAFSDYSATLTSDEQTYGSQDGVTVPVTIEHSIEGGIRELGLEHTINVHVLHKLAFAAGINLSYLVSNSYTQKEYLAQPATGLFETGTRIRNEFSGTLTENNSLFVSAVFSMLITVPLAPDGSFTMHPELSYLYSFVDILQHNSWKANAFRVGLSLRKTI